MAFILTGIDTGKTTTVTRDEVDVLLRDHFGKFASIGFEKLDNGEQVKLTGVTLRRDDVQPPRPAKPSITVERRRTPAWAMVVCLLLGFVLPWKYALIWFAAVAVLLLWERS